MFLKEALYVMTDALKQTFDDQYPEEDFRNLHIDMEFPIAAENYPGVWVDFEPSGDMETAHGAGGYESEVNVQTGLSRTFGRWRFQGFATYTIVSLTSLERARLFDEMMRVIAFGTETSQTQRFRHFVENNPYVGMEFNWDKIGVRGFGASPGTPWGSNEILYEVTIAMECVGEVISDGISTTLVPLAEVDITAVNEDDSADTSLEKAIWR